MHRIFIFLLFVLFHITGFAQESDGSGFKVKLQQSNPSPVINDSEVEIEVDGGTPPFKYQWSNKKTPLTSAKAEELTEGIPYTVKVSDAEGETTTKTFEIPAASITEKFNSWMKPAVDNMASILFWDPFEAVGLYDPKVYTDSKEVPIPNWDATTNKKFHLKKWLKEEGAQVKEGDKIAIVSKEGESDIDIYAPNTGNLSYLVDEGDVVFNPQNKEDVIEQGAHHVAKLTFDEPIPLLHPNGTQRKNSIPFIVIWLIIGSIFFTIKLGFVNIRGFKHSIDLAKGKFDDPDAPGKIRHFQAMTTAVSATVGLGNIAGVAVAVSLGGAGATFWMFIAGFFAMSLKFVECTLGVKYREIMDDGRIFGGPMNYLRYGLEKRNMKGLGKFLAILFAVLGVGASFGGGNMLQSNQAFEIVAEQLTFLQGNGFWFGIGFAVLVGIVIIGGIDSIANVTSKVVPFMALVYILGCLIVIGFNIENIGAAFSAIFNGALSPQAMKGGFLGVLIIGLQRAAFSSEAGVGSAAIAHSASKTNNPIADGFTALVEPF
ncbi:MAG TPA: amino acid carrier protein, partial [Leeuwenhoekiella sp.]|nr:amino acid carrier protein [Leeuwenhoekiella sp.]